MYSQWDEMHANYANILEYDPFGKLYSNISVKLQSLQKSKGKRNT